MTASERFKNLITGAHIDRLPVIEWAPWWDKTIKNWHKEGLPKNINSVYDIQNYFGLDKCLQTLYNPITFSTPSPKHYGAGIIKNEKDYQNIKSTLYPDPSKLYNAKHYDFLKKTHNDGDTIHFMTVPGFFWFSRDLFGIEPHLYSFYDNPELLHIISQDYLQWLQIVFDYIRNTFQFDFMSFAEDMSYNNGPMLSKKCFDEFLAPYYKNIIPIIKELNIPVFIDSDGDITKAVDWYSEVGADGMFPLERQAGVDVSLYIDKHPEMSFMGHFDKMCMKFGENAMRKEFERLLPSAKKGKLIISVDHQTPPDVSFNNYKIFVKLFHEYAAECSK